MGGGVGVGVRVRTPPPRLRPLFCSPSSGRLSPPHPLRHGPLPTRLLPCTSIYTGRCPPPPEVGVGCRCGSEAQTEVLVPFYHSHIAQSVVDHPLPTVGLGGVHATERIEKLHPATGQDACPWLYPMRVGGRAPFYVPSTRPGGPGFFYRAVSVGEHGVVSVLLFCAFLAPCLTRRGQAAGHTI